MQLTSSAARGMRRVLPLVFLSILFVASGQSGCPSTATPQPQVGPQGPAGLACWDTNGNGTGDASEDVNGDGLFNALDCQASSRIYGDGSAGPLTITADTLWTGGAATPPADFNTQFTDFVVNPGVSLRVPSGIVIRCTGTFTNNGQIVVRTGSVGALVDVDANADPGSVFHTNYRQPGQGIATCLPSPGEYAIPDGVAPRGGFGGCGIDDPFSASFLVSPGVPGGGGGAADFTSRLPGVGGDGGGTLVVLVRGAIVNTGSIRANGDFGQSFGGGGGGGGIIILASQTSVTSSAAGAVISASGGPGGESNASRGPGGGGGGGIVHLIAPAIEASVVDVLGGAGAIISGDITATAHQGGAGGGGSFGDGGTGGSGVPSVPARPGDALHGENGIVIQSLSDPGRFF